MRSENVFAPALIIPSAQIPLSPMAPLVITARNKSIRNKKIITNNICGLFADSIDNIYIGDCTFYHFGTGFDTGDSKAFSQGRAIQLMGCNNTFIERCNFVNVKAPKIGQASDYNQNHIFVSGGSNSRIRNVRGKSSSSFLYVESHTNFNASYMEGYDFRGPEPRGQLFQAIDCTNPVLSDFYTYNDQNVSWTEDIVNVGGTTTGFKCDRGLINGLNSPSGSGLLDESAGGSVWQDIDILGYTGGGADVEGPNGVIFNRIRCGFNFLYCRGNQYTPATSTTARNISDSATGVTFTTQAGLTWFQLFDRLRILSRGTGAWMDGAVQSYSGTTLTLNMVDSDGSTSSHSDWDINLRPGSGGLAFTSFDPTTAGTQFNACKTQQIAATTGTLFDPATCATTDITDSVWTPRPGIRARVPAL